MPNGFDPRAVPTVDPRNLLLPPGGEQFLTDLDELLALQEKKQLERLLGEQESRGLLRSGQTNVRLAEEVLGPSLTRRRQALFPLAQEERGGELGFQRQRQLSGEEFMRKLDFFREEASLQRELLELQAMLQRKARPSLGRLFGESLVKGLGEIPSSFASASGFGGGLAKNLAPLPPAL
jgi:hypothetical protein